MRPHTAGGVDPSYGTILQPSTSSTSTIPSNSKRQLPNLTRPSTAPSPSSISLPPTTSTHTRKPKISIKDIWGKDTGGGSSGSNDLLSNLEAQVRRLLEEKRHTHDHWHHEVEKKVRQVEQLQLQLADLTKDGEALGLEAYPSNEERLEAVKSISNRKLYCKHTSIREMEAELNASIEATKQMRYTGMVHEHMKKRLVAQRIDGQLKCRAMKEKLKEANSRLRDLERKNIQSYERYGAAQFELAELHKSIDQTMEMWNEELSRRKEWAEERIKFEKFCEDQLEAAQDLELKVMGDLSEAEERKFVAINRFQIAKNKVLIQRNHDMENMYETESKRLMLAFKSIGVDVEKIQDVDSIVKHIASFKELNENLLAKKAAEETQLEELRKELQNYKNGHGLPDLDGKGQQQGVEEEEGRQVVTSNRVVAETEKQLNEAHKKLEVEKTEYRKIESMLQPIYVGFQNIAEKVLGADYNKGGEADIGDLLERIRVRLEQYMEFCAHVKPDKPVVGVGGAAGVTVMKDMKKNKWSRIDSSLNVSTKAFIASSNADLSLDPSTPQFTVSPYNIRIRTKAETRLLESVDNVLEPAGKVKKGSGKNDGKLASMFEGEGEEDDEDGSVGDEEQVFDRNTLKKKSHKVLNEEVKARKRRHRLSGDDNGGMNKGNTLPGLHKKQ